MVAVIGILAFTVTLFVLRARDSETGHAQPQPTARSSASATVAPPRPSARLPEPLPSFRYRARLSERDHRSGTTRLQDAAQIIEQDRFHNHQRSHFDPEDEMDSWFGSLIDDKDDAARRYELFTKPVHAALDADEKRRIQRGSPIVEVVFENGEAQVQVSPGGCEDYLATLRSCRAHVSRAEDLEEIEKAIAELERLKPVWGAGEQPAGCDDAVRRLDGEWGCVPRRP
jgi:hypothetical protein